MNILIDATKTTGDKLLALQEFSGKKVIHHWLDAAFLASPDKIFILSNAQMEELRRELSCLNIDKLMFAEAVPEQESYTKIGGNNIYKISKDKNTSSFNDCVNHVLWTI